MGTSRSEDERPPARIYVAIHGHFYQPPRENPYLEAIERQPSAHPCHDWNERVYRECYRPNAFARVFDAAGNVSNIVNNFEYLSFNVGPTLLSWLERHDVSVYQRILDADRRSCARLNGHGNAIAQAYNHAILPLANARDRQTQIQWGIADFQARFGRDPEGMWLPETAVDYPTLQALAVAGMRFAILAPSQAARCRALASDSNGQWCQVSSGGIDATRSYRCFLDAERSSFIDLFFYDGASSREMAFGNVLHSAEHLSAQLARAFDPATHRDCLLAAATDGETFGHHKLGGERCLAYAFTQEFPARGWQTTNFAHYLSEHPPEWEVEILPNTAWSCSHGLGRWQSDCGCGSDRGGWRQPLRASLDWLRDRLAALYEEQAMLLLRDPWAARDAYSCVLHDRAATQRFLSAQQRRPLTSAETCRVLSLLEMQRQALLMYTSCGWFFETISRPESVQVLRYAARGMDLARALGGPDLEPEFLQQLAAAPGEGPDGAEGGVGVYQQLVAPGRIPPAAVAVHWTIATFLGPDAQPCAQTYCYQVEQQDYHCQQIGDRVLVLARLKLGSDLTWETHEMAIALLHFDDWDFHASVLELADCPDYPRLKYDLFACFAEGEVSMAAAIQRHFGDRVWGLEDLFSEERHRILHLLGQGTRVCLERAYGRAYRENQRLLVAYRQDGLPVPPELQLAAEVVLSERCAQGLRSLERAGDLPDARAAVLEPIAATVAEAEQLHCHLRLSPEGEGYLRRLLWRSLQQLLAAERVDPVLYRYVGDLLDLARRLEFHLGLDRAQELYCQWLQSTALTLDAEVRQPLLALGQALGIDNDAWLARGGEPVVPASLVVEGS